MGSKPGVQGSFYIQKSINITHHVNKIKDKNHMIISVDVEKSVSQNPTPVHDKNTQNWAWKGTSST